MTNVLALPLDSDTHSWGEKGVGVTANRKDISSKGHHIYLVHCKGKTLRSVVLDNATDFPCTFIHATFPSFVPGFCLHAFKKSWEVSASLRPKQNNKPEDQSADLIIRNERKVTGSSRHFQLTGCMEGVLGLPSAMDSTSSNQSWKKWAVTVSTNQPREESRMGEWVCSFPSSLFLAFFFFWPGLVACGMLVPWPGIEPVPPRSGSLES